MNRHKTSWTNNLDNPKFILSWDEVVHCVKMVPYVVNGRHEMIYYPTKKGVSRPYSVSEIAKEYGIKIKKI